MTTRKSGFSFLLRLVGVFLFFQWCYILISTHIYLFSDPLSLRFWSEGAWKVLIAAFVTCGLIIAPSESAQSHKLISGFFVIVSLLSSFFLLPGNFFSIKLFFHLVIHGLALVLIYKNTPIIQTLFVFLRIENKF